jgi:uncharacterized protein (TIGR00290 family)
MPTAMTREKIIMGWSGGKDSSLALREIRRRGEYEVTALVTTCTEGYDRISMHGVRSSLLERQARELGIPLQKVFISQGASNDEYEARMKEAFLEYKTAGITKVAFGDLFLEDIRAYRDRMMASIGMTALYPVWGLDTRALAREFVRDGFSAVLVCIDPRALDKSFAGRTLDDTLLDDLPANIDPCGENGEFHSFVFQGPIFRRNIRCARGEIVLRDNFYFADLLPEP